MSQTLELFFFESLLIKEITTHPYRHPDDWKSFNKIVKYYADDIFASTPQFSKRGALAVAVIEVGAQCVENFKNIFSMLREWESSGGCYWVCAEELFRHWLIYYLRAHIEQRKNSCTQRDLLVELCVIAAQEIDNVMESTRHSLLQSRLLTLRDEMRKNFQCASKADEDQSSSDVIDLIEKVTPLSQFTAWFVNWGSNMLAGSPTIELPPPNIILNKSPIMSTRQIISQKTPKKRSFEAIVSPQAPKEVQLRLNFADAHVSDDDDGCNGGFIKLAAPRFPPGPAECDSSSSKHLKYTSYCPSSDVGMTVETIHLEDNINVEETPSPNTGTTNSQNEVAYPDDSQGGIIVAMKSFISELLGAQ